MPRLELEPALEPLALPLLPEDVLLRGAALPELDFEVAELFVDVFAVVDDFAACEGSSSP